VVVDLDSIVPNISYGVHGMNYGEYLSLAENLETVYSGQL